MRETAQLQGQKGRNPYLGASSGLGGNAANVTRMVAFLNRSECLTVNRPIHISVNAKYSTC